MQKRSLAITCESLIELDQLLSANDGEDIIKDAIEYIESKKAVTINPAHVSALLLLKQSPVASS